MNKECLIIMFICLISNFTFGQKENLSLSIIGGKSYTLLENNISDGTSSKKDGYVIDIQINKAISNFLAIGSGIGFSNYSTDVSLDVYSNTISAIDTEGESYQYRLNGSDLRENQSIYFIDVPLNLIIQNRQKRNFKTFLQLGISALIPIHSSFYCTNGVIESRGYYPQYRVELMNMPNHGFDECILTSTTGKLPTQIGLATTLDLGAKISLGDLYISIAAFVSYGVSSICKNRELLTYDLKYQSLSSIAPKVIPYAIGIKLGVTFPLNVGIW
ncbi:MAG TPA: outer membrane beta-barrel protein [Paludibacter sp.]